ncbi:hypothetical protein ACJX0J_030320, partial [Zea mays]
RNRAPIRLGFILSKRYSKITPTLIEKKMEFQHKVDKQHKSCFFLFIFPHIPNFELLIQRILGNY